MDDGFEKQPTLGLWWGGGRKTGAVQKVRQGSVQSQQPEERIQEGMPSVMEVGASEVEELQKTVLFGYREVIYDFSFYQDTKLAQLLVPASKINLQERE